MKKIQNPSNSDKSADEYSLSFTYAELLALNKLLGKVNGEATLTADDLHLFTLSPLVTSANKKIHKAFKVGFRKDLERRNIHYLPKEVADNLDEAKDFQMNKYVTLRETKQRFQQLGEENKQYIRSLEGHKLRDYCALYFAPFIPMEEHMEALMEILGSI